MLEFVYHQTVHGLCSANAEGIHAPVEPSNRDSPRGDEPRHHWLGDEGSEHTKPGLSEKAYENALRIELRARGMRVDQQRRFEVRYQGDLVDILVPDLLVNDLIIVDPKVVEEFNATHVAQMTSYLAITRLRVALLLNFKHIDLRWRRVIR